MRELVLVLLILGLGIAIVIPSTQIQARPNSRAHPQDRDFSSSQNAETIAINQVAEREQYSLVVGDVQRARDAANGIVVSIVIENRSGADWYLTPQNFMMQDRAHIFTYPAQAHGGKNALRPGLLRPGEKRSGELKFDAPLEGGLDLAFGLLSSSPSSYIKLIP